LDACYAACGLPAPFGNRRRKSLRDVFESLVGRAAEWPADALLIAGDLFDLDRVSRDTVAFLQAQFDAVRPMPVFIAPGNRDPYVPHSPYAAAVWPDNVVIFDGPAWHMHRVEDKRLAVQGFGFDGAEIGANPFGDLVVTPQDGWVQVAVGHGAAQGQVPQDKASCAPFDAAGAVEEGLAYLALGHVHAVTEVVRSPTLPDTAEVVRSPTLPDTVMYYAGAPEGHGFEDTGPRHWLEVEIDADGVRVTPAVSSRVHFSAYTVDCSNLDTVEAAAEAIRAAAGDTADTQVARVTLTGVCEPDLHINTAAIHGAAAPAFEALVLVDETVLMDDYEDLARENTCLGLFVRNLTEELADAPDEARRRFVLRARELGLAAYRQRQPAICDLGEG